MTRHPIEVVITWDDACSRHVEATWDGTLATAQRIAEHAPLYKDRQSIGWLVYCNEECCWLASDYDSDEGLVSTISVIPIGWISKVRMTRGRVIYSRGVETPKAQRATSKGRAPKE